MQELRDRLLSPESLQRSGVASLADSCGVLGGCHPARTSHPRSSQDPTAKGMSWTFVAGACHLDCDAVLARCSGREVLKRVQAVAHYHTQMLGRPGGSQAPWMTYV